MTEWHGIQQFEYRWQPGSDFSPIAGSRQMPDIERWAGRIALWVRHRTSPGAPTESVRYEVFRDGMAALAWRQRNAQPLRDEIEGRPEVTRLLMGQDHILTPEVAMAVCRAGLPPSIGPLPGQVGVNRRLAPVNPAELAALPRDLADDLDRLAASEQGLSRVIAAALTDCDTALSVQLPQRIIALPPHEGPQGPLLWGLWRTVWPLLGPDSGLRGWSFSTYEPPLGHVDTGSLADIVFRAPQATPPGGLTRGEILVRPHDPAEPPAAIRYQDFARLLVDAYRHLGGEKLVQHLETVGAEYDFLDERIEGVQRTLLALLPSGAISAPPRRPSAPEAPDQPEAVSRTEDAALAENKGWPHDPAPPQDTASRGPAPPQDTAPRGPAPPQDTAPRGPAPPSRPPAPERPAQRYPDEPAPPTRTPMPSAPALSPSPRSGQDAPPLAPPGSPIEASPPLPPPPYPVTSLVDQLYAGPADPDFEPALQALWDGNFPDLPADRATARQLVAERDWYLSTLLPYGLAHLHNTLEAVFRSAVIPDLNRPEVAEELAGWADERAAPPPVIAALNAAAQGRPGAPELMRQILEAPLASRWLSEHGIYPGPSAATAAPAPRRPGAHAARPRSTDPAPEGRWHAEPITLVTLFCVVLLVLLVLALVHH